MFYSEKHSSRCENINRTLIKLMLLQLPVKEWYKSHSSLVFLVIRITPKLLLNLYLNTAKNFCSWSYQLKIGKKSHHFPKQKLANEGSWSIIHIIRENFVVTLIYFQPEMGRLHEHLQLGDPQPGRLSWCAVEYLLTGRRRIARGLTCGHHPLSLATWFNVSN